jgi:hypothetical protein
MLGAGEAPHDRALRAVLEVVTDLLDMELAYVGRLDGQEFTFTHVRQRPGAREWPGICEGSTLSSSAIMCSVMAAGAPAATADATHDPAYAAVAAQSGLGIVSYAGVTVPGGDGLSTTTLCGVDREAVRPGPRVIEVLSDLASVVAAQITQFREADAAIRRTASGWRVGATEVADLPTAMTLSDLLRDDPGAPPRPERQGDGSPPGELDRLRDAVGQLEHALAARVIIEQAIGVLSERHHTSARTAFDALRSVARRSGRRVRDLAQEVVASATDPSRPLPAELGPAPLPGPVPGPLPGPPPRQVTLPLDRQAATSLPGRS